LYSRIWEKARWYKGDLATEGLHIPAVTMADRLQMLWERENHPMF
jgi:hypothetical protein